MTGHVSCKLQTVVIAFSGMLLPQIAQADSTTISTVQPIEYSNAVSQHAKQTTTSSLFPGYNFENLAYYLQRESQLGPSLRSSHRQATTDDVFSGFPFVTGVKLDGIAVGTQNFEDPSACPRPSNTRPAPIILFLKGKPTSGWLTKIGADYKVDPTFFNDHLDFRSGYGRIDYFAFPPLPLARPTIMQLPYITLGQLEGIKRKVTQPELDSLRERISQRMNEYWAYTHELFDEDSGVGQSIVRDFYLHDHVNFAIEQRISVALCREAGSWQRKYYFTIFTLSRSSLIYEY